MSASQQWELLQRHRGSWLGVQTLYDYAAEAPVAVGRSKLSGSLLVEQPSGESLEVWARFPSNKGEVDWSSAAALDADSVSAQQVTALTPANLHSTNLKLVDALIIGGPNIVPGSHELTFQLTAVDGENRLKLQCIYEVFDRITLPGSSFKIPFSFVLQDVVLTRELKTDQAAPMSPAALAEAVAECAPRDLTEVSVSRAVDRWTMASGGTEHTTLEVSTEAATTLGSARAPILFHTETVAIPGADGEEEGGGSDEENEDEDDDVSMVVVQQHGGDVLVELPRVIVAAEQVSTRLTWAPRGSKSLISAEIFFSAMESAVKPKKRKGGLNDQIDQPVFARGVVDRYQIVE